MQAHSFKVSYRHNILGKHKYEVKGYSKSQTERGYLLKYYPKYYKQIFLDKIDAPTIAKIKGLKRLHHFEMELCGSNKPHNFSLVLLQKVRKDLKTLPKISQRGDDFSHLMNRWYGSKFREVKYFSGVESIEITRHFFADPFKSLEGGLKNSKRNVNRILIYLAHAKNLKRIDTSLLYKMPEFLVKNLTLSKKLKGEFNIFASLFAAPTTLSNFALQSSPFSQNLIQLNLERCSINVLKEMTAVLEILQDIKSLKITEKEYIIIHKIPDTELKQKTLCFYKALEALTKLEQLSLNFNELVLEWLNNFALPKSLQVLSVNLGSDGALFPVDSILENFCLRIRELPQLEIFCLRLSYLKRDEASCVWDFAINLLQGIPRLSCLRLELPSCKKEGPMECGLIFAGIQHLMPVLRELTLNFFTSRGSVAFSPSPEYRFSNLEELNLNGYFSPPLELKKILMMMEPENKDSTSNIKPRKLEIQKIMISSQEDSEGLLKSLHHIGPIEPHMNLKLHVEFSQDLIMILIDFIKGIRYIKGLSLHIWLKEAMKFHEIFEVIKKSSFKVGLLGSQRY